MSTKIFPGLILWALMAICCQTGCMEAEAPLEIDVMSFNIRYGTAEDGDNHWDNRREMVMDIIRQHSPDLIGIQEALRFQLDEIRDSLSGYGEIGIGRDGETRGEYSAILYRVDRFDVDESGTFWLSDTPKVPSVHWGNACIRICTWGRFVDKQSQLAFYLFNTHLDHESQSSREKSVRLIVESIQARERKDPFVVTGDFNAGENNPAIEFLKSKSDGKDYSCLPLIDTYRALYPDEPDVGTFNGFQGKSDGEKIDYIFVGQDTNTLEASIVRTRVDGRCPSDHEPVTARIQLKAGSRPE